MYSDKAYKRLRPYFLLICYIFNPPFLELPPIKSEHWFIYFRTLLAQKGSPLLVALYESAFKIYLCPISEHWQG